MSSFIGAALPWMGGKVSDLLGFAGREEGGGDGLADENNGAGRSSGDGIGGDDGPSSVSGSTVFPPSPLSSRRDVSSSPRVSRVIRGRGRAKKARHHPRLAAEKAGAAAPSSHPEVIDVTEEYTSGGNSSRESPAHAPIRRVRGRSQGSSPDMTSTAGTSDGITRREGDYRYSGGGNTPQRTGSLGVTRRDVDWRIPWTGGSTVPANARRRSFSVSPGSASSTARSPMASTFWETGNSTVAGPSGCRRANFGGSSGGDCSRSGVKKDGSSESSAIFGDGNKKRRAETAGIDGQNCVSEGGGGAAKVKKRDREGLPKVCESTPGKGERVSVGGVAEKRESSERNRSGSGYGADGSRMGPSSGEVRSVSKTMMSAAGVAALGIAKESEFKKSGKESREPESSWKADFFSSGESDTYQESVRGKPQDEERLLRSPSCGTPDRADTTWSTSLHDEDDDGPGVGGYNGSLIANGAGGNTWRAPRRQKSLSAVFSSGGNKALVPAPLPRSRPRLSIGEGSHDARPCDRSGYCSRNGGSSGSEGCTSSGVSSSESLEDSGNRRSDDGLSSSRPASSGIAPATGATFDANGDAANKPVVPGRLAWCGDRRLLPRPSATLQLRRNAPKSSLSSSSAAAYLGRLDLTVESRKAGSRRGSRGISTSSVYSRIRSRRYSTSSGVKSRTGEFMLPGEGGDSLRSVANEEGVEHGGSENASKAAAAAATAAAVYAADDAVTLSSSCMSVTSGEESDSDEVLMMVDDQDDPDFASGVFDGGTDGDGETAAALDGREGEEKPSGTATSNVDVIAGEAAGFVSKTGKNDAAVAVKEGAGVAGIEADDSTEPIAVSDAAGVEDENLRSSSSSSSPIEIDDLRLSSNSSSSVKMGKSSKKQNRRKNGKANQSTAATVVARPGVHVHTAREDSVADAGERRSRAKPKSRSVVEDPLVPPQPPSGPRKWPARPPHRALVYAAAAEASRRARGFTGWSFPALPPPPPPPPTPSPPPIVLSKAEPEQAPIVPPSEDIVNDTPGVLGGGKKGRGKMPFKQEDLFLGFAKNNPPGKASPNEFGWMALDPMHTAEGRAAAKKRALLRKRRAIELAALRKREELERRRQELERIALQKRQEILDALKIKEEIAEARRKRKLNILFLGMTRVAEYDSKGGLTKGMKRFDLVEKMVRQDVDETNMNPLRDTARVLAMEALGHEVRCISKVSTPGESDSESSRSTRAKGGPTGLGRFLATDMTNTGASRGFLRRIEEKWSNITFDTVLLDHYWLPDSVVWLNKGYMANDGGLIQNLVKMTTTKLLRDDFEIMLPINQAFFELLLPHFKDLEKHFTVEFLVGERLEHLKRSHIALEADDLIPADVMLNTYGKQREHQVSQMLGVKQPTAEVAAILLKYGVAAQHFCYARFLKLSRNPPPHPALAAVALTAASESAKIAEEAAKIAAEQSELAAQSAKEISEFDQKENRAAAAAASADTTTSKCK